MLKLTKTQLIQLADNLNAAQGDQTAQALSSSDIIAYSWSSSGHKTAAIYWHDGQIYKTTGI